MWTKHANTSQVSKSAFYVEENGERNSRREGTKVMTNSSFGCDENDELFSFWLVKFLTSLKQIFTTQKIKNYSHIERDAVES